MRALELHRPRFAKALANSAQADGLRLAPEDLEVAYWAAATWGGQIALSKDQPNQVADLPLAIRLAQLAYQAAPDHGHGALASLMGSFEAARPCGSQQQASRYFDQASTLGVGKNAGALLAKAENIALPAGDRAAFDALLQQALAASASAADLQSAVVRQRALWLLATAKDLF